jgi:hypothetical protein
MADWQDTFWYRVPCVLSRKAVYSTAGFSVFALFGMASLFVFLKSSQLQKPLSDWSVQTLYRSTHFRAVLNGLEPARQAAVPARLEGIISWVLPLIGLVGIGCAAGAALAVIGLGRFLGHTLSGSPDKTSAPTMVERRWLWGAAAAFAVGLLAHLPFIRLSLSTDELDAALHVREHWFAWADTSLGWMVHVGGEFLARLSMDLLGDDDRRIRAGSAVLSAAGLSVTYIWVRRHYGLISALLTTGLLCALPLWAEQTTLVRGYGVLFFAGALQLWALWHILDESNPHRELETLGALLISNVIGFSGHFFYLFFALTSLSLLGWHAKRRRSRLAATGLIWAVVGLIPAGVLYLPGLPATLFLSAISGKSTLAIIEQRFVDDFGFRLPGRLQWAAAGALAACFITGLFRLRDRARWRVLIIVAICLGVPLLSRTAFFYPRYFIFLCPLLFVATLPLAHVLEGVPWLSARIGLAFMICLAVWALPKPFAMRPSIDVRAASASLAASARSGDVVVIDNFLAVSQYYLPLDLQPTYVNTTRGIPPGTDVLMIGYTAGAPATAPSGFSEIARALGRDMKICIFVADDRNRRASSR